MNSLSTENSINVHEALEHLKKVVKDVAESAKSFIPTYTSILLICFCWESDDVNGSMDCNEISQVFKDVYNAEVVGLTLEMKKYSPMDVLNLTRTALLRINESQLVVLFYR